MSLIDNLDKIRQDLNLRPDDFDRFRLEKFIKGIESNSNEYIPKEKIDVLIEEFINDMNFKDDNFVLRNKIIELLKEYLPEYLI